MNNKNISDGFVLREMLIEFAKKFRQWQRQWDLFEKQEIPKKPKHLDEFIDEMVSRLTVEAGKTAGDGFDIDWTQQHCGVHQATLEQLVELMPDLKELALSLPEDPNLFVWDVKVHMLMPGQYPCIPNWHYDNVPRVNNVQDFSKVRSDLPMYLWISKDGPFTEFEKTGFVPAETWVRFTQEDKHRGTMSEKFCWRGFIRATHKGIMPQNKVGHNPLRRHSQVYLDANNFSW